MTTLLCEPGQLGFIQKAPVRENSHLPSVYAHQALGSARFAKYLAGSLKPPFEIDK